MKNACNRVGGCGTNTIKLDFTLPELIALHIKHVTYFAYTVNRDIVEDQNYPRVHRKFERRNSKKKKSVVERRKNDKKKKKKRNYFENIKKISKASIRNEIF